MQGKQTCLNASKNIGASSFRLFPRVVVPYPNQSVPQNPTRFQPFQIAETLHTRIVVAILIKCLTLSCLTFSLAYQHQRHLVRQCSCSQEG
jgi:hypothetical protein